MGTSSKGDNQGQDLQEFLPQVLGMLSDASGEGDHVHSPQTGSHRADALQLAIDEFDRLREVEPLMLCIISHVGALKERIRAGIEVIAFERGSRLVVAATAMG